MFAVYESNTQCGAVGNFVGCCRYVQTTLKILLYTNQIFNIMFTGEMSYENDDSQVRVLVWPIKNTGRKQQV